MLEQWYGKDRAKRIQRERAKQAGLGGTAYVQNGSVSMGNFGAAGVTVDQSGRPVPKKIPTPEEAQVLAAAMKQAIDAINYAADRAGAIAENRASTASKLIMGLSPLIGVIMSAVSVSATPVEVRTAVVNALKTLRGVIDARLVKTQAAVLKGDLEPSRWFGNVSIIEQGIQSVLAELGGDQSVSAQLSGSIFDAQASFNTAWSQVKTLAGEAATAAQKKIEGFADGVGGIVKVAMVAQVVGGLIVLWLAWPILKNVAHAYLTAPLKATGMGGLPAGKRKRTRR